MQYNTPEEVSKMIFKWCQYFDGGNFLKHFDAVSLIIGTAAAESGFKHREQIGGGPARGLWQMEPYTAIDIWNNYLSYQKVGDRKKYWRILARAADIPEDYVPVPQGEKYIEHYLMNDDVACVLARIHYKRVPKPIPPRTYQQANYWKKYYNTEHGAGTVGHYLGAWFDYHCEELVRKATATIPVNFLI